MPRFRLTLAIAAFAAACSTPPPPPPASTPTPAPAPAAPAPEASLGSVQVTASALNVRRDPSPSADVLTLVKRGERLTLLATTESWSKVRLQDGTEGWVSSQHVSRDTASRKSTPHKGNCPPDSDYAFVTTPTPAFSDRSAHGLVVVDAYVNTQGRVTSTKVVSNTTGDESLAFMAEREIKSARFIPPVRNCVPREFIFTYKRTY